jgi:hypothetical protein
VNDRLERGTISSNKERPLQPPINSNTNPPDETNFSHEEIKRFQKNVVKFTIRILLEFIKETNILEAYSYNESSETIVPKYTGVGKWLIFLGEWLKQEKDTWSSLEEHLETFTGTTLYVNAFECHSKELLAHLLYRFFREGICWMRTRAGTEMEYDELKDKDMHFITANQISENVFRNVAKRRQSYFSSYRGRRKLYELFVTHFENEVSICFVFSLLNFKGSSNALD